MIRKLLTTTAIATVVATGAFAQSGTTTTTNPAPAAPAATTPAAPAGGTNAAPADTMATQPVAAADGQLASNLIGETVYNGTGDDAENIGNVNDLVLSDDGQIEQIVIGVGGFLGIGEKNVSVSYDEIDWAERDGDRWIVVATTSDALRELPAFDRRAYEPTSAVTGEAGTAGTATAPATGTAPAGSTMAPATNNSTATAPAAGTTTMAPAAGTAATTGTDTDAANTSAGAVDRNTLTEVPADQLSAENLEGTTVYGAQDANVGDIGDVVVTADGKVDAVIIDVGGFLGIGEKPVAVGMDDLKFMQDANGNRYLYTTFTEEQLEAQPEYEETNWETQRDQMRMRATQ